MSPTRCLVLVHTEGWQALSDFEDIARLVRELAPDIEVLIASNLSRSSVVRKWAAKLPTLVFSPLKLMSFDPARGRIYEGRPMSKLDEMARLRAAGLPVPHYEKVGPQTVYDPAVYGPYAILKPSFDRASFGRGIQLVRAKSWRYRGPQDWPEDHPGRRAPMILQKFVESDRAMSCRVLTVFGRTIFTYCRESTVEMDLDAVVGRDFQQTDFMPAFPDTTAQVVRDPDMLELAAAAYRAIPEVPLQGCDIIRARDGSLHLLEINPGGGTWMFSNPASEGYRKRLGVADLRVFFDATRVFAETLIEKTRTEAC